ncbi:hypothetical protein A2926_00360 [Candidatus Giovannonibacteria bacterium RIFCSPLOWO2_01_FULL_44_40]|uniref:DUF4258 domain-containing protein n=1 Tax=Candidatus Giovannonibacteria bacterium RIFCSPHIGHO2_01_FULL_45_23 TaxID=1798325 RepID=A0A1F5VES8_9BACT|nr:MAG: hypothetical protein A2834_00375 [Candidatus Giovannonibacteria bacterium RIFCSPHIGHO2_01_FULL_45_23]OGF76503.1 MAG: hypothetical protein A3C77_03080 [Candidatus Giovannonibacteria bacterium RIFCSPHIGHO2_02_FULL_45_13]OGF79769.1 MAG: hypothetical protein A2926_00360 [Candidatus Giovannonibacteria bacterium RIFCSPLOWO2_01_FULL_44_40]
MIIFTNHALKRMRERKVSRAQVLETIKNPEIEIVEDGNIKLARRGFAGKSLEVAIENGGNKTIVITLYWL